MCLHFEYELILELHYYILPHFHQPLQFVVRLNYNDCFVKSYQIMPFWQIQESKSRQVCLHSTIHTHCKSVVVYRGKTAKSLVSPLAAQGRRARGHSVGRGSHPREGQPLLPAARKLRPAPRSEPFPCASNPSGAAGDLRGVASLRWQGL